MSQTHSTSQTKTDINQKLYYYEEQEKLKPKIQSLLNYLHKHNIINNTQAQYLEIQNINNNQKFNNNFPILAKNSLLAVIIGGLLLMAAGRLIYEK